MPHSFRSLIWEIDGPYIFCAPFNDWIPFFRRWHTAAQVMGAGRKLDQNQIWYEYLPAVHLVLAVSLFRCTEDVDLAHGGELACSESPSRRTSANSASSTSSTSSASSTSSTSSANASCASPLLLRQARPQHHAVAHRRGDSGEETPSVRAALHRAAHPPRCERASPAVGRRLGLICGAPPPSTGLAGLAQLGGGAAGLIRLRPAPAALLSAWPSAAECGCGWVSYLEARRVGSRTATC